ncbi:MULTISPECIES: NAD(P)/FAD-dependent oxidoreductase [Pseudomonas]|uniref:NAD(P)/FAD-dependent oxidoreductase n=1 Tax=Pseudomonas TaxID=286 RepID=UPI0020A0FFE3|nr:MULTISPECIES: FAD-binding oxidoreductase [Pseudomonas]MCP1455399.1 D-amino-acid dehydrogenase [Pseudomonas kilonensis]UVM63455.1 FAD-binding oxidoreductase [Pseudomonas sp. B21-010]WPN65546.1 FAD-binding oxidoreductase [Pseudomonas sp. P9_32]WPN71296.1 FAD-binding oxidoreductase [Pseudomonas sp. P9_35]
MTQPVHCEIAVIGAGVVGVATARWLRRQGYRVLVLERDGIAAGASYGNAGTLAPYGVMPIAQPSLLRAIPSLLFSADSPFVINWARLPRLMPWLLRFLNECRTSRCAANTQALATILQRTYSGYEPLLADTPLANQRLRHNGCLYAYGTQQGFAAAQAAIELRRSLGIAQQVLSAIEIEQLEPALAGRSVAGLLFPESSHMDDPKLFIEALAAPLVAEGVLRKATVIAIKRAANGLHLHSADGQQYLADRVVLCGGAWSGVLAAQMGDRIPLDTERGYHIEFDLPDTLLNRPCCPVESAFYMTPMAGRLRVAGTVELGSIHDPANPRRFDYLEHHVRRVLGLREPVARRWLGFRPSLPDSLPVIGPSPNEPRLIYAFGHQHLGLTLAGATGQLVTECIAGTAPQWLERFSVQRF